MHSDEPVSDSQNPLHSTSKRDSEISLTLHKISLSSNRQSNEPERNSRGSITSVVKIRQSSYAPIHPVNSRALTTFMLLNYMIGM